MNNYSDTDPMIEEVLMEAMKLLEETRRKRNNTRTEHNAFSAGVQRTPT